MIRPLVLFAPIAVALLLRVALVFSTRARLRSRQRSYSFSPRALALYVVRHGLAARGDGVWVNPAGCR